MAKVDNKILKETLKHYISLEYYANGLDEEFQTLLNELQKRCSKAIKAQSSINTKSEYNVIYKIIKEEVEAFQKELEERLDEEAELVMKQEMEFLDSLYNKAPAESKDNSAAKNTALVLGGVTLAKLLFAPIDGRDTTKQFVERTGRNILRSYDTPLRAGYLFGQKSDDVITQIDNQLKQVSRGMQSGIRTAIPSYAKTTDRSIFLFNNSEVVWVATLDGRTCINCASLSGLHFKLISEAPSIQHCLCRCVLLPAFAITEPIPTYEEFIEMLNEEDQKSVLGINRYKLWKENGIALEKFINNGNVISVKELKKQYAATIRRKQNKNLIIPEKKLTEYALNPAKSDKAIVFKSALGYTLDNYNELIENILSHLNQDDMIFLSENEYGKKYRNDLDITGPNGNTAKVRTGWILRPQADKLQLTTVFVR